MVADLIGARKEARRRKRVWEEWAIREYGGVGIAYNNPNVTFSKVDDMFKGKVEKILKGGLDLILSPSPSVKIQIMGGKVYLK